MTVVLTITPGAATLIRTLTQGVAPPEAAGLRISAAADRPGLSMTVAPEPQAQDTVLRQDGAQLFLSAPVAELLSHARLHAEIGADRSVFYLDRSEPDNSPLLWRLTLGRLW